MQEIDNKYVKDLDDEINLPEMFFALVQGKRIITYVTSFFFLIGIIYSLLLPNIYKAEALLAPVDESSSLISGALSQYSGLAGLAGISLPDGDTGSNSKKANELMNSLSFFEDHIISKIFLPNLMAVEFWDREQDTIVYDESIYKEDSNTWVRDFSYPQKLIPSAQESFKEFKDHHFSLIEDKITGYFVLSIEHQSPSIAKKWVEVIFEEVNSFYRKKDKEQSEKAVDYLNKQMSKTSLSEVRTLTAQVLQKEIQKLALVEANEDYVFEYIYPPSLMEEKSEPLRLLIVIFFTLLGVILGIIGVLFRHYITKINSEKMDS